MCTAVKQEAVSGSVSALSESVRVPSCDYSCSILDASILMRKIRLKGKEGRISRMSRVITDRVKLLGLIKRSRRGFPLSLLARLGAEGG